MKALVYEEYAPDNDFERILKIKDIDEPKPKSNEVVFKVKSTALNYDDEMLGQPTWTADGETHYALTLIEGSDAENYIFCI